MEQKNLINLEDATKNFSQVIAMVEQNGSVTLQKDNNPMYIL